VGRTLPLGIGVIGAGEISRLHALAYAALPGRARRVAVADLDLERAQALAHAHGFEHATADPRELLAREDVDVVSICTRPNIHAPLVAQALESGKHVLCEKPIARTLAEADAIVEAADRHPDQLVSFLYQWRHDRAVEALQGLLDAGELGRPLSATLQVRAHRSPAYYREGQRESWALDGGGALIVIGVHQLDLLLTFLGEPEEASARMDTTLTPSEADDALVGWIRFRGGALATLSCTVGAHSSDFELEVQGEDGFARLRGRRRGRPPAPHACDLALGARGRAKRLALLRAGLGARAWLGHGALRARLARAAGRPLGRRWQAPASWWHGPAVREFLDAVAERRPAPVPPREARRSLELALGLYESATTGSVVRFPLARSSLAYRGFDAATLRAAS
jgi:predicted dehydrogenase